MIDCLKITVLLSVIGVLSACQHAMEEKTQRKVKDQKLHEAVSYNVQLGMAYLNRGNMPRAKRKLLNAFKLEPNSPDVNSALAFYLEKTGEIAKAEQHYQKAVSLAPKNGAQLNNYGTFLCRQGQHKLAEEYFIKAINDANYINTPVAYENAGLCAQSVPDDTKAISYFSKALHQDPRRKQSLYEIAKIELKNHRSKEALEYLKNYSQIALQDPILLGLAIEASHNLGYQQQETAYRTQLSQLKNEANHAGEYNGYNYNG